MTAPRPPAVPDELVERATRAHFEEGTLLTEVDEASWRVGHEEYSACMRAALAAVADDLRAEGRRECVAEVKPLSLEWCRRCRDLDVPLERAVVILWGKLLPPEHLGPRCEEHAAEAIGWDALRPDQFEQWAGYDLRPLRRLADSWEQR